MNGRNILIMRQPPQQEKRIVSIETEIGIPNRAAFSIMFFVFGILFTVMMSGRIFDFWVPGIIFSAAGGLSLALWAKPKTIVGFSRVFAVFLVTSLALFLPLKFWYASIPIWKELLMELGASFIVGGSITVYFHWNNTRNPNWPPPFFWMEPEDNDVPLISRRTLPIDDQSNGGLLSTQQLGQ